MSSSRLIIKAYIIYYQLDLQMGIQCNIVLETLAWQRAIAEEGAAVS